MLYIAGGDHLPFFSRQVIGPRPPVPPMPTANFFTLGRIMMQLAFARTLGGTSLLATMACKTVVALRMVSSSSAFDAAQTGRVRRTAVKNASREARNLWIRRMATHSYLGQRED